MAAGRIEESVRRVHRDLAAFEAEGKLSFRDRLCLVELDYKLKVQNFSSLARLFLMA